MQRLYAITLPASPCPDTHDLSFRLFRAGWILALGALVLNLGQVAMLGNINAIEKALFLLAGILYLAGKPIRRGPLAAAIVVLLTIVLGAIFTRFFAFSWTRAAAATAGLFALLVFLLARPTARERSLVLESIALVPVVLVLYGLLLSMTTGTSMFFRDHTGALRLAGALHPAFLAAASYAGALSNAFLYEQHKRLRPLALCVASLVICVLTGTRMPSVCAAASCALVIVGATRGGASRIGIVALGVIVAAAFLFTFGDQILVRFLSGSSSGREDLWRVLEEWIVRHPLAGVGLGHHGLLIPESITRFTRTAAAHNEYLRVLVELGYPGALLFIGGLFSLFVLASADRAPEIRVRSLLLVGFLFVYAWTDNVFYLTYCLLIAVVIAWAPGAAKTSRLPAGDAA